VKEKGEKERGGCSCPDNLWRYFLIGWFFITISSNGHKKREEEALWEQKRNKKRNLDLQDVLPLTGGMSSSSTFSPVRPKG